MRARGEASKKNVCGLGVLAVVLGGLLKLVTPLLPLVAKTSLNVVRRSVIGRELLSWRDSFLLSVEHQKPDRQKITTPALPQHHPHRVSSPW